MKRSTRNRVLALVLAISCSACANQINPTVTSCFTWPQEGDAAYDEIQRACGGVQQPDGTWSPSMPNCTAHQEWRGRLKNLKGQIEADPCHTEALK